jgi:hypothetical protein
MARSALNLDVRTSELERALSVVVKYQLLPAFRCVARRAVR